jgi:hypothetical protein
MAGKGSKYLKIKCFFVSLLASRFGGCLSGILLSYKLTWATALNEGMKVKSELKLKMPYHRHPFGKSELNIVSIF